MTKAAILVRDMPCASAGEQEAALRAHGGAQGLVIASTYRDPGEGRRTARRALLRDAGARFEVLLITAPAVLGRTLPEVVAMAQSLRARGVRLISPGKAGCDLTLLLAAAPVLAAIRVEHARAAVAAGRQQARARGVRFGRPPVDPERRARVHAAIAEGLSLRAVARRAGVGVATVARLRADLRL